MNEDNYTINPIVGYDEYVRDCKGFLKNECFNEIMSYEAVMEKVLAESYLGPTDFGGCLGEFEDFYLNDSCVNGQICGVIFKSYLDIETWSVTIKYDFCTEH